MATNWRIKAQAFKQFCLQSLESAAPQGEGEERRKSPSPLGLAQQQTNKRGAFLLNPTMGQRQSPSTTADLLLRMFIEHLLCARLAARRRIHKHLADKWGHFHEVGGCRAVNKEGGPAHNPR